MSVSRRTLLRASLAVPAVAWLPGSAVSAAGFVPFVDDYTSNTTANLTAETNAAVRILSGVSALWQTGTAWNTGVPLDRATLRANVRFCETRTASRTAAEGARAFVVDRQHQSYAVIAGLGPLAPSYRAGSLAVTGITSAPETTPATTVSDFVPTDAPAGSALGAGSPTSSLGDVVTLVNTVRGNWSSSNPSKFAVQYPRPWRLTTDSAVVDTGAVDAFGYPVYRSKVVVVPQLLRQRGTVPAEDGGFPSGHTNALFLAALAYAYAVPERFQELLTCAFDLADTRITAGMHSPLDVVSGRILATALAAAILNDPANADLKAAARAQAAAVLTATPGADDPYADRVRNRRSILPRLTYILPRTGRDTPLTVPKGAEVLLETRQPYLTAAQRRAVLRTTALPGGYALLDGPEQWGRLDLFKAADGYGAFENDVDVTLGAGVSDTWRNDISGRGGLTLRGSGTLALTGANTFRGGVRILGGTLAAESLGDVTVDGGTLQVSNARVTGILNIKSGNLVVNATKSGTVLTAQKITGRFAKVTVATPGLKAEPIYARNTVQVRITRG
ncbi:phosphatase PAP2 family protein [Actinoplanes sp. NBRC 101535]|uniref:phosphatase PAP2 family protein n=1 Tax=Actinoplanes sp. NBRC 101535 TaxID=3032196 RepID=UPI0024A2BAD2|nr:phosphatase PAP2 family protein [Actinoplanes sp. NBRC 101535]GLY04551.1 phosphoesterase [Actinoplanes sp. NBRC 101535]